MHPAMLQASATQIWQESPPSHARQIVQLWNAIEEFERSSDCSIGFLLRVLYSRKPDNPDIRVGDTAALWAVRYYYYRMRYLANITNVNVKGVSYILNRQSIGANYHILNETNTERQYFYFKYGSNWSNEDSIATLSCIRAYNESLLDLDDKLPVYKFVCLLEESEHVLSNAEFESWIEGFYPLAGIMYRSTNA